MTRSGDGDELQNLVRLEIGDALKMIGCKQDDARGGYRRPLDGCAGVGMSIFDKRLTNVFTWGSTRGQNI